MIDNPLFTVLTTLISTAFGTGIAYLSTYFSERRKIKSDKDKQCCIDKTRLKNKSLLIIQNMCFYYNLIEKIYQYFNKNIDNNNTNSIYDLLSTINRIKAFDINCKKIILSEDDIIDIHKISGIDILSWYTNIIYNINTNIELINSYKEDYKFIMFRSGNESIFIDKKKFEENRVLMVQMFHNLYSIYKFSKENIKEIRDFLFNFVNSRNFPDKNIEIKLPKIDGGFETIKRTVP